jgi:hypothetical protein
MKMEKLHTGNEKFIHFPLHIILFKEDEMKHACGKSEMLANFLSKSLKVKHQ